MSRLNEDSSKLYNKKRKAMLNRVREICCVHLYAQFSLFKSISERRPIKALRDSIRAELLRYIQKADLNLRRINKNV
jgi:hypothetical protein